ncbi:MAG: hypothetical protein KI792_10930 [Alphaproteobacteria bacterium]|nr:hypothetical protein [Alphaproteobacteria bacterium SS10]
MLDRAVNTGPTGSNGPPGVNGSSELLDTLIINLDYVGSCAGSCPVCALSAIERKRQQAFLNLDQIEHALDEAAAQGATQAENLVLGIGRGNVLDLGPDTADRLNEIAHAASDRFQFNHGLAEIATSVMGRLSDQIESATRIHEQMTSASHGIDPRFVVVANAANTSAKYWEHLCSFIDHMSGLRGHGDGSGNILLINLSLGDLPPVEQLLEFVGHYRFPVNVTWAPPIDPVGNEPARYEALEEWLLKWYAASVSNGMDSSLVQRTKEAMFSNSLDMGDLRAQIDGHGNMLLVVDNTGDLHYGFSSVSADMDPVRFASGASQGVQQPANGENQRMVKTPAHELAKLVRWRTCRACPYLAACVVSGGYKSGLLTIDRLLENEAPVTADVCPSGLRSVFRHHDEHVLGDHDQDMSG